MALAYVEYDPAPGSPADEAGLCVGDAILRFGEARTLEDIPALLVPGAPILLVVRNAATNAVTRRAIVPRVFDPLEPRSLLGVQLTVYDSSAPADEALAAAEAEAQARGRQAGQAVAAARPPPEWLDEDARHPAGAHVPAAVIADAALALAEADRVAAAQRLAEVDRADAAERTFQEADRADAAERLAVSYERGTVDDESSYDDDGESGSGASDGSSSEVTTLQRRRSDGESSGGGSTHAPSPEVAVDIEKPLGARRRGVRAAKRLLAEARAEPRCGHACARLGLAVASLVNLVAALSFIAAPSLEAYALEERSSAVISKLKHDVWRAGTSRCSGAAAAVARALEEDSAAAAAEGGLSLDSFAGAMRGAVGLQLFLCASGLLLAALPVGGSFDRVQRFVCALYPPTAIALWLLLAAVTMYCVAFRLEAEALVHAYWRCLDPSLSAEALAATEARRAGLTSALYSDVTATAAMCGVADAATVGGLFAACSLIGWRDVLRTGLFAASAASAAVGAALVVLAAALSHASALAPTTAQALLGLGASVVVSSAVGCAAALRERAALIQFHAALVSVAALGVLGGCGYALLAPSAATLDERLGSWAGVATDDLPTSLQHYGVPTDGAQLVSLVHTHRLSLATVAVLLFFLLVMNLALVVGMRWLHADRRWSAQYAGYGAVMASD